MTDKILEILKGKYKISGGHCGTYPVDLVNKLDLPYSELRTYLNQMYKEKLITIHNGSRGKIIKIMAKKQNLG